jgi:hypothetical protein
MMVISNNYYKIWNKFKGEKKDLRVGHEWVLRNINNWLINSYELTPNCMNYWCDNVWDSRLCYLLNDYQILVWKHV